MIKCPSCQALNLENALFCEECGFDLYSWARKGSPRERPAPPGREGEQVSPPVEVPFISLSVVGSGLQAHFPLHREILLGRLDAQNDIFPDFDLTAVKGAEKGVSRRHARIMWRQGQVLIEDLGSTNGTFVNRQRLSPYLPHPLKSGDEIRLGALILQVEIREGS